LNAALTRARWFGKAFHSRADVNGKSTLNGGRPYYFCLERV
jgi:hypothetical protein